MNLNQNQFKHTVEGEQERTEGGRREGGQAKKRKGKVKGKRERERRGADTSADGWAKPSLDVSKGAPRDPGRSAFFI